MKSFLISLLGFVSGSLLFFASSSLVKAATFDIAPNDVYGPNGLVNAMLTSNTNGEDDIINLAPDSDYVLTYLYNPEAIYVPYQSYPSGTPVITANVTINANGSTIRRDVDSADRFRIFTVRGGNFTIDGAVITGGNTPEGWMGGAILNGQGAGLLTVKNSKITGNQATHGSGIATQWSSVTVENSEVSNNSNHVFEWGQFTAGGGIAAVGYNSYNLMLTISNSTFINNTGSNGGAIYSGVSHLTVTDSTFTGNNGVWGGAIYFGTFYAEGTLNLTGNTFNNNNAYRGGGIFASNVMSGTINNNRFGSNGSGAIFSTWGPNAYGDPDGIILQEPLEVHGNCFPSGGNNFVWNGILNESGYLIINAQDNWWGDASGPSGNWSGTGAYVYGININFQPYLTTGCPLDHINQAPTVSANGPYSVNEGSSVQLSATGSDPDNDALTYAWDLDNDGTFETPGQIVTFSALNLDGPMDQQVKVQVSDGNLTGEDTAIVAVTNVAPTAVFNVATPVILGNSSSLSLDLTVDPGLADTENGFHFSFTCDGLDSSLATSFDLASASSTSSCLFDAVGTHTVKGRVFDKDNGFETYQATINVTYNFTVSPGGPFDPFPTFTGVKAGRSLPVRFSLGGDQGLNILDTGYPKSEVVACDSDVEVNGVEATFSNTGLTYDATSGQYVYVWKTDSNWKNTCRQLVIKFVDGTYYRANFWFE